MCFVSWLTTTVRGCMATPLPAHLCNRKLCVRNTVELFWAAIARNWLGRRGLSSVGLRREHQLATTTWCLILWCNYDDAYYTDYLTTNHQVVTFVKLKHSRKNSKPWNKCHWPTIYPIYFSYVQFVVRASDLCLMCDYACLINFGIIIIIIIIIGINRQSRQIMATWHDMKHR